MEEIINKYPHVTVKTFPEIGYQELSFDNGDWITHQHTCPLECPYALSGCNGDNATYCRRSVVNITESQKDAPVHISKGRDCVTCGNPDGDAACNFCDESLSGYR